MIKKDKKYCLDCGTEISYESKKCVPCYLKTVRRTIPVLFCKICNRQLGKSAFYRDKKICHRCSVIASFKRRGIIRKRNFCSCGKEILRYTKNCKSCAKKGKNNPSYIDGRHLEKIKVYGDTFTEGLKELIRFREGYKCKLCGCPQLENGGKLDIHHIDYNKKHSEPSNLVALCDSCHGKTNHDREKWKDYFKLIYEQKSKI